MYYLPSLGDLGLSLRLLAHHAPDLCWQEGHKRRGKAGAEAIPCGATPLCLLSCGALGQPPDLAAC